jgi:predicted nucleic acid-binding protein
VGARCGTVLHLSESRRILECLHATCKSEWIGFSISEADERASLIESKLNFAADSEATHREWRRIVVTEGVSGVQVHDARLVAAMHVHQINSLLTLNVQDFRRYGDISVVSPLSFLSTRLGG